MLVVMMEKATSFNDFAIVSVNGNDYRIHFWFMNNDEVMNLLRNADLTENEIL